MCICLQNNSIRVKPVENVLTEDFQLPNEVIDKNHSSFHYLS